MREMIGWFLIVLGFVVVFAGLIICTVACSGYCTQLNFDNKCLLWYGFYACISEILGLLFVGKQVKDF